MRTEIIIIYRKANLNPVKVIIMKCDFMYYPPFLMEGRKKEKEK